MRLIESIDDALTESKISLNGALRRISGPLRGWIYQPSREIKKELQAAYEGLRKRQRQALADDVLKAVRKHHGGDSFIAYRNMKSRPKLRGLDSVTTDPSAFGATPEDMDQWYKYKIDASDVLVHWGQNTPLGSSIYKHEKEIILKPNASIKPLA